VDGSEDGLGDSLRGGGVPRFSDVEMDVVFKNAGKQDSPILSDIQALEMQLDESRAGEQAEFRLHHHTGSPAAAEDYRPQETVLGPKARSGLRAGVADNRDLS